MLINKSKTAMSRRSAGFRLRALALMFTTCGVLQAALLSAQGIATAGVSEPSIVGTVADANSDPIPNAKVSLQAPDGGTVAVTTIEDGSFALHEVRPGVAYQIAVTAEGFADWKSSITVDAGQDKALGEIKLRILTVERTVTVSYSSKEVAAQQLKAEEQQRVLGFIPNMFVTYEPHPEPLTSRMKFHLAYRSLTHPTFFAYQALWSGIQQAGDMTDYTQDAEGYGQRFGANLANGVSEGLFANAILPSLLHQDPRYFYRGSGTKTSRVWHAAKAPFICQGDNGKQQPNYSQMGGSLIAAALSNTYYPDSSRGPSLVFASFGTSMGLHVALGLAQEFVLSRFTSKHRQ